MTAHVKELFDLTGRAAIVTGGSRGLGREMAEGLAEAGASLMLCARREEWLTPTLVELNERGFNVEGPLCDVTNPEHVQAVVDKTLNAFGKVDILVNNAGISWGERPETMPLDRWQKVLDVNLTGAFLFAQAAGREMLKREQGCIINVSSISGLQASADGPYYVGYAASKAGLFGLTRELAATWGRQGIRVNAIAPGFFHSRLTEGIIGHAEASIKARGPRGRAEGRRRLPRLRRVELHHGSDHRRGRRAHHSLRRGSDEQTGSGHGSGHGSGRVAVRGAAVA